MDSNAVIDFFNSKLNPGGKDFIASVDPRIFVITQIELLSKKNMPSEEWEQLQGFYTNSNYLYTLLQYSRKKLSC